MAHLPIIFADWKYSRTEVSVSEPSFVCATAEIAEILQHLFYLKSRRQRVLPLDLARLKVLLDQSHPGGAAGRLADYGLLHSVGMILARQHEPMSMGELSRAVEVPLSSATRIVDWLVENAYAERQPDADDRRIVRVELTEAGLELYRTIQALVQERVARLLRHFAPEECATLTLLLRKLLQALEEET
jgi:MarR family transcriptional repressor of emrRAB